MPWGDAPDNNDGKQKNNKKNNSSNDKFPWGSSEKQGASERDITELFKRNEDKFKNIFLNSKNNKRPIIFLLIAALTIWFLTGFYQVNEGEEAVVLRFGKYVRTATTGLNYHIPDPIEKIIKEKTGYIRKEEIGGVNFSKSNNAGFRKQSNAVQLKTIPQDNLVLTGDENILDINYVIQWKISNLKDYIFNVSNATETVRNVAESALREVVGNNTLAKTYTDGRFEVELDAKQLAQKTLDLYKIGVEVTSFQMMKVDPPLEVIDAFREVQNAKADKEREINIAQAYRGDIIPRARGQAAKFVQEGEAYRREVVERAIGDSKRFDNLYGEYKKAKQITKNRMYLDMMQEVMEGTEKVLIDNKNGKGVIPYLPLPDFNKKNRE